MEKILFATALSSILILSVITLFIFKEGLPHFLKFGINDFIFGMSWRPNKGMYGIFPFIIGSIYVTIGALIIGVPFGLGSSVFITEFLPRRYNRIIKPSIELLAGIPSVVYGFMAVIILAPLIRQYFSGPGFSVLASSIVLGIMILPTIISITIDSLNALPPSYREGSLALGATKWQTSVKVLVPAAGSGILAGILLGLGRAIGETMAVIMIAGNSIKIPESIFDPVRTLTSNIALEMGYAVGDHRTALFATGMVLFIFIMIINMLLNLVLKKGVKK